MACARSNGRKSQTIASLTISWNLPTRGCSTWRDELVWIGSSKWSAGTRDRIRLVGCPLLDRARSTSSLPAMIALSKKKPRWQPAACSASTREPCNLPRDYRRRPRLFPASTANIFASTRECDKEGFCGVRDGLVLPMPQQIFPHAQGRNHGPARTFASDPNSAIGGSVF